MMALHVLTCLEFTPMPRRSAAAVDFMHLTAEHDRPPPPEGMAEPQAVIWRKTVASMRATWFTPECHDLLSRYCGAMAEAARLEAELPCVNVGPPVVAIIRPRAPSHAEGQPGEHCRRPRSAAQQLP